MITKYPIPFYPGYFLTDDLQIIGKKGKPLALCDNGDGYRFCCVTAPEKANRPLYLHRAVALVHHFDTYFEDAEVNHKDANPGNCNPDNLEWVTRELNQYLKRQAEKMMCISAYIDQDMIDKIDEAAIILRTSRSSIIRMSIEDFIADVKQREAELAGIH